MLRYLFHSDHQRHIPERIAIVGGGGEIATKRLQPSIASLATRRFECVERREEPASPHPYRHWRVATTPVETEGVLRSGGYSAAHLSTPPHVTGQLLHSLASSSLQWVTAEKPWFGDWSQAQAFSQAAASSPVAFRFWDHYLYLPSVAWLRRQELAKLLGSAVESVHIQIHESTPATTEAQANTGALGDLAVHGASMVRALFLKMKLMVIEAKAAKAIESPGLAETFARVALRDASGAFVVVISAGKYLPPGMAGKCMSIIGQTTRLNIDLTRDIAEREQETRTERLYSAADHSPPEAYVLLAQRLAAGNLSDLGLELSDALIISRWLRDARAQFPSPLPTYDEFNL